jgi:hypothetical protein
VSREFFWRVRASKAARAAMKKRRAKSLACACSAAHDAKAGFFIFDSAHTYGLYVKCTEAAGDGDANAASARRDQQR